uniref:Frizzled class receptor 6 n=1 Tax=Eptatretus burgeri TaxID=7764 RepID=A0A8C4NCD2_EPTBU
MFTPCCLNMLSRAAPTARLFMLSAWCLFAPRGAGGRGTFACEPLTLRMCLDMPYNLTRMPNMLGHYDQRSAGQAMEVFHPLVNLNCHPDLRPFLCAAFAPTCMDPGPSGDEEVPVPLPCQQTCVQVTAACSNLQQLFDVVWPTHLECQRLRDCMFNESSRIRPTLSGTVTSSAPQQDHRDLGFWCPREYKAMDAGLQRPQLAFFLTKYLTTLAAGIPSVFWVSSCKTVHEWASFLLGRRRGRFEKSGQRVLEDSHDLYSQALLGPSLSRGARRSRGTSTTQGTSTLASSNALEDGVVGRGRSRQNPHAHEERHAAGERRDKSSKRCRPRPVPPGAEKGIAVEEKLKGPQPEHHSSQEACE